MRVGVGKEGSQAMTCLEEGGEGERWVGGPRDTTRLEDKGVPRARRLEDRGRVLRARCASRTRGETGLVESSGHNMPQELGLRGVLVAHDASRTMLYSGHDTSSKGGWVGDPQGTSQMRVGRGVLMASRGYEWGWAGVS